MFDKLQDSLALAGRLLLASLFLPAGIFKLTDFAGAIGYISSVSLPVPQVGAALAIVVEIGGGIALIAGYGTRVAAILLTRSRAPRQGWLAVFRGNRAAAPMLRGAAAFRFR